MFHEKQNRHDIVLWVRSSAVFSRSSPALSWPPPRGGRNAVAAEASEFLGACPSLFYASRSASPPERGDSRPLLKLLCASGRLARSCGAFIALGASSRNRARCGSRVRGRLPGGPEIRLHVLLEARNAPNATSVGESASVANTAGAFGPPNRALPHHTAGQSGRSPSHAHGHVWLARGDGWNNALAKLPGVSTRTLQGWELG
jgi:hypothetical protein